MTMARSCKSSDSCRNEICRTLRQPMVIGEIMEGKHCGAPASQISTCCTTGRTQHRFHADETTSGTSPKAKQNESAENSQQPATSFYLVTLPKVKTMDLNTTQLHERSQKFPKQLCSLIKSALVVGHAETDYNRSSCDVLLQPLWAIVPLPKSTTIPWMNACDLFRIDRNLPFQKASANLSASQMSSISASSSLFLKQLRRTHVSRIVLLAPQSALANPCCGCGALLERSLNQLHTPVLIEAKR